METLRATVRVNCREWQGEVKRIWGSIGYDEINWTYMPRGKALCRPRVYNPFVPVERESPSSALMMRDIRAGLETVAAFPQLAGVPVIVDECDPSAGMVYGVYDNPNFIVTNTEYYPNFLCALVKRILDLDMWFNRRIAFITTWAFYFEGKRFFEGNRTLVTAENIEKSILNGFRLLSRLGQTRLRTTSTHSRDVLDAAAPDREVDALATLSDRRMAVLLWHQADAWWETGEAKVQLELEHLPFEGKAALRHYRIDGDHSNAYAEWVRHGKPQDPSPAQIVRIKNRQGLESLWPPQTFDVPPSRSLMLDFSLPLFGTSLLEVEPA